MTQAMVNNIQIEYETFGDSKSPPVLLIAGLGAQLIYWQKEFCEELVNRGYYVIRFDNRDIGLSSKIDGLSTNELLELVGAIFMRQPTTVPYSLDDMANDAIGLLDHLNIDKAHIVGKSMGGFIAQKICLNHQNRVLSLTSIYSHPGKNNLYQPTQTVMETMLTPMPEDREKYVNHMLNIFKITYGTGISFDEEYNRSLLVNSYDRCFSREGYIRQYLAILTQKDRTENLQRLSVPALVVHGDEDPMVPVTGGEATANAIPNAKLKIIKGMGHVAPNMKAYWSDILDEMAKHMN